MAFLARVSQINRARNAGAFLAAGIMAALLLVTLAPFHEKALPFTNTHDPSVAWAQDSDVSEGCYLSEADYETYLADGTLDERIAYMESLGNGSVDSNLIESALANQTQNNTMLLSSVPSAWQGAPSTGDLKAVLIRVEFSDMPFADTDTEDAFSKLVNGAENTSSSYYPTESLRAYYERSSYGQLHISGQVFSYTAKYERSHYKDKQEVLDEVLDALDSEIDFTQFDGNNDGIVDAVYMHVSGGDTGWGSLWWSKQWKSTSEKTYDDMAVCAAVMLTESSTGSARTICHETGHVLGLPDLYTYNRTATWRTGTLSWDLMETNCGDLNAYFKWLLGWISDEQITYVIANEDGITVTRGGTVLQKVTGEGATVDVVVDALNKADSSGSNGYTSGGFTVVANENNGMFSKIYLLEYTTQVGNTELQYSSNGTDVAVPAGFRIWRVQGELTDDGSDYKYSNTTGGIHNIFLEMLDFDQNIEHNGVYGTKNVAQAKGATEYGCFLTPGNTIDSTTFPSTNFNESIGIGFTGLSFTTVSADSTSGTMRIGYSSADKPDFDDFTLTADNEAMPFSYITFTPSWQVTMPDTSTTATLKGGEKDITCRVNVDTGKVSCYLSNIQDVVKQGQTLQMVFPEGAFLLGYKDGEPFYSPEMTIDVTVGPLATLTDSGQVGTFTIAQNKTGIAETRDGDTTLLALLDTQGNLEIVTTPNDDLSAATHTEITVPELSGVAFYSGGANLYAMGNGIVALQITPSKNQNQILTFINLNTGTVIETSTIEQYAEFAAGEDGRLYKYGYSGSEIMCYSYDSESNTISTAEAAQTSDPFISGLYSTEVEVDGQTSRQITVTARSEISAAGEITKYAVTVDDEILANAIASGNLTYEALLTASGKTGIILPTQAEPHDLVALPDGGYAFCTEEYIQEDGTYVNHLLVYRCDAEGNLIGCMEIDKAMNISIDGAQVWDLQLSPSGTYIAIKRSSNKNVSSPAAEVTILPLDAFETATPRSDDSKYPHTYDYGQYVYANTGLGSDWTEWATYNVFERNFAGADSTVTYKAYEIEVAPSPTPDPTPNPSPISGGDSDSVIPNTGDATFPFVGSCIALMFGALATIISARKRIYKLN